MWCVYIFFSNSHYIQFAYEKIENIENTIKWRFNFSETDDRFSYLDSSDIKAYVLLLIDGVLK